MSDCVVSRNALVGPFSRSFSPRRATPSRGEPETEWDGQSLGAGAGVGQPSGGAQARHLLLAQMRSVNGRRPINGNGSWAQLHFSIKQAILRCINLHLLQRGHQLRSTMGKTCLLRDFWLVPHPDSKFYACAASSRNAWFRDSEQALRCLEFFAVSPFSDSTLNSLWESQGRGWSDNPRAVSFHQATEYVAPPDRAHGQYCQLQAGIRKSQRSVYS